MALIGLCGFAGSGKGTVADMLVEKNFQKISFADSVKDATSAIFGWPRELLEGDTVESREFRETPDPFWSEKFGVDWTPRMALQKVGTEAGRDVFHPQLWIYSLEKKLGSFENVVIPDVRFPNEIAFIKSKGGKIVRVFRGTDPKWYMAAEEANAKKDLSYMKDRFPEIHISEWAWIGTKFDWLIGNNSGLSALDQYVKYMLHQMKNSDRIQIQNLSKGE